MKLDGLNVRKSSSIGYRNCNIKLDKDYRLKDYSPGNIAFINIVYNNNQ